MPSSNAANASGPAPASTGLQPWSLAAITNKRRIDSSSSTINKLGGDDSSAIKFSMRKVESTWLILKHSCKLKYWSNRFYQREPQRPRLLLAPRFILAPRPADITRLRNIKRV